MHPSIESLPGPEAGLREIIRFSATHDPTMEFRAQWGVDYPSRAMGLWSDLLQAFKSGSASPARNAEELLMCLSYDIAVGPYCPVPESQTVSFHQWLVQGLRRLLSA
jgi:hypothetical protein